ncbi:MAG: histidine phosphatase family protein [Parcubacteria group bacterium]|nr:histidine phosphatase family protein [Parcubacteria group bacterium]
MKRVYFVRHGETENNVLNIHQGSEPSLTERGREQAKFVAERLARISFDALISSDYVRACETARMISEKTGKPVVQSELFRERKNPSEINGKPHTDPEAVRIRDELIGHQNDPDWRYSDEENFFDTRRRALSAIVYLENLSEENLVVITHGTFLIMLIGCMMDAGLSTDSYRALRFFLFPHNTGITVCEKGNPKAARPDKWQLITWNDHAHLG